MQSEKKVHRVSLPKKDLSVGELASLLKVLASTHHTSLPSLLRKLDRVSGNLEHLEMLLNGNNKFEWTEEEDALLEKNEGLLHRWKGLEAVETRKKYL